MNRKLKKIGLLALVLINVQMLFAQQTSITGKVVDAQNQPLPGVTVVVKGKTLGTVTDFGGIYTMKDLDANATLVFSFVGMRSQEVPVQNQTTINITLQDDAIGLEEIVAVGYGTQKKATLTSSIATVKAEDLENIPVGDISNALVGKLSGLITRSEGGEPGSDASKLFIRGVSTTGESNPLIVIDGVPGRKLTELDPNDIETISILKDASAVAPYGARGANGVILVTSKRGKKTKPTVSYTAYTGWQQATRLPEFCNSFEYATLQNEGATNIGKKRLPYTKEDLEKYKDGSDPIGHPNTDWADLVLSKAAPQVQNNIALSGGNEKMNYYVSAGFLNQDGLFKGSNYKKYNFRSNVDAMINENLKLTFDISGYMGEKNGTSISAADYMYYIIRTPPTVLSYLPDVGPVGGPAGQNPQAESDEGGYRKNVDNSFNGKIGFDYEAPFLKGLKMRGVLMYDKYYKTFKHFNKEITYYEYNSKTGDIVEMPPKTGPSLLESFEQGHQITTELSLSYNKTINDHNFGILAVYTEQHLKKNYFESGRSQYASSTIDQLFAGPASTMTNDGWGYEGGNQGMVGRFTYNYASKYLFESNFRYDNSPVKFPKGKSWGFFPSFAMGWRLSEEDFLADFEKMDNLKLRVSWGKAGNDQIDDFQYSSTYAFGGSTYIGSQFMQTSYETRIPNQFITWEKATMTDIGLEGAFFNSKLSFEIDYFYKRTTDILRPRMDASIIVGMNPPDENIGVVDNRGFDMSLTHRNKIGEFSYSVGMNFTFAQNKAVELSEPDGTKLDPYRYLTGRPLDQFIGYQADGLFVSEEEIENAPFQGNGIEPGDIKYVDFSGPEGMPDDTIDFYDQTAIGFSPIPEIIFGFNLQAAYKGFDMIAFFQGAARTSYAYEGEAAWAFHNGGKAMKWQMDRFHIENNPDPNAAYPRMTPGPMENNKLRSSFWIKDASYLRLKNVQIGYSLKKDWASKLNIERARIYVSGQNLFTWSEIDSFDPESGNARGWFYPQVKTYTVGLNLTF
ncbi:MAG: SusC/RagA family TonB-linked outer membrane protein [Prolixibacteraceae bacterium]